MPRTFSVGYFAYAQYDVKAQVEYFARAQYDVKKSPIVLLRRACNPLPPKEEAKKLCLCKRSEAGSTVILTEKFFYGGVNVFYGYERNFVGVFFYRVHIFLRQINLFRA